MFQIMKNTAQSTEAAKGFSIMFESWKPSKIVELGTGYGGLTRWLQIHLGVPIVTYDVKTCKQFEGIVYKTGNIMLELKEDIIKEIQIEGPLLLLCDDGNKKEEFNTFAPYLKDGDVVCTHDFASSREIYHNEIKGKIWNWCEITLDDIRETIEKCDLHPFYYKRMSMAAWGSWRKGVKPKDNTKLIFVNNHIPVDKNYDTLWGPPFDRQGFFDELVKSNIMISNAEGINLINYRNNVIDQCFLIDLEDNISIWSGMYRNKLMMDGVLGLITNAYYNTIEGQNADLYDHRKFGSDIWNATDLCYRPTYAPVKITPSLTENELKKMHSICNLIWASHKEYCYRSDENRPIDVMFIGSVSSYFTWTVKYHRKMAMEAIKKLPNDIITLCGGSEQPQVRVGQFGLFPSGKQHYDLLTKTKVAISPYGYAEISTRDCEAILAGCVLIKPNIDDISVWPKIPYVKCDILFRDLTEVVTNVLANYSTYQEFARHWAEVYHLYKDDLSVLSDRYYEVFS